MNPLPLTASSSARPLVLLGAFLWGLGQRRSDVWLGAAVLALVEGAWWATSYRSKQGRPLHPYLVIAVALGAWPVGVLRSGAWLIVLSAEWLVRPALWDGGIITHGRKRRAGRKARKLRAMTEHAPTIGDGVALAAAAARAETGAPKRRWLRRREPAHVPPSPEVQAAEATSVGMTFVHGVIHQMSDGSQRYEEMPR